MKFRSLILPAAQKSSGFSLIEVIVSISLLSIALAVIIQVYSMNMRNVRKADLYTQAIIHARSVMEETLALDEIDETSETDDIDDRFEVNKSIARLPAEEEDLAETYEITVNVSWQGGAVEFKTRKSVLKSENE